MTELAGGHLEIVRAAKVLCVLVVVAASMRQGQDVVDDSGDGYPAFSKAVLAEAIRAGETAPALDLPCPAP